MLNKEGKSSEHPNIALFDLHPSVRMKTVQGHDIETDNVCIYISDIYIHVNKWNSTEAIIMHKLKDVSLTWHEKEK